MKASLTAYYNRDPRELVVDKPEGEWMAFDAFLKSLGFRPVRQGGRIIPGRFNFLTGSPEELDWVEGIVKSGGEYLTGGNLDSRFQV